MPPTSYIPFNADIQLLQIPMENSLLSPWTSINEWLGLLFPTLKLSQVYFLCVLYITCLCSLPLQPPSLYMGPTKPRHRMDKWRVIYPVLLVRADLTLQEYLQEWTTSPASLPPLKVPYKGLSLIKPIPPSHQSPAIPLQDQGPSPLSHKSSHINTTTKTSDLKVYIIYVISSNKNNQEKHRIIV